MTVNVSTPLAVEQVPIDQLRPDPANPRRISNAELEALTRSLQEFGFVQPVLARREDNTVIGGHQRLLAARRLGYKTVPVTFLDLTLEQARLLNLALNKICGEWDQELLARMLADLKPIEDIDLSLSGFSEDELGKLLKSPGPARQAEQPEDVRPRRRAGGRTCGATRATGELWALGDHRAPVRRHHRRRRRDALHGRAAGPACASPTRPTTSPSATTAASSAASASAASRTTPCPRSSGRPSAAAGPATCSRHVDGALYVCMSTKEWPTVSRVLEEEGGHWSRHDHLGQGPLRPGPGRLPAPVRADLVRLAGGREALLVRRPRPGRRLAHRAPRRPRTCTRP